jgi:hypothetical protein
MRRRLDGSIDRVGRQAGFPDGEARALALDDRGVWASTRDVLCHIVEPGDGRPHVEGCLDVAYAVEVELHVERDRLRLSVRDDGRGLDPARPSEGHGLANMRRRAEQVRGSLEIGGDPERGTTVLLEAPLRGAT